jgi:hypothetical protein
MSAAVRPGGQPSRERPLHRPDAHAAAMFYFFHKGRQFLRCEIRESGSGFVIAITDPSGTERLEHLPTSDAVHERWLQLQQEFSADGWWGPHGRE